MGDLLGSLPPGLDRPALPPAEHHKAQDGKHAGRPGRGQPAQRGGLRHGLRRHHGLELGETGSFIPQVRRDVHLQRLGLDQGRLPAPFRAGAFVHEFDRHRPDQVLAGVRRLELVVEPAPAGGSGFGGPFAVVADEEVAHGLTERRRFDLDAGLELDADLHLQQVGKRGARGQTRTESFTGPFSAVRSIASSGAGDDAASLRSPTPQPATASGTSTTSRQRPASRLMSRMCAGPLIVAAPACGKNAGG